MFRREFIQGIGATAVGFWNRDQVLEAPTGIQIKDVPSDHPQFEREYRVKITDAVSMKITIKNYGWTTGLSINGELTQSNGRWVLFEPERPADKILDRDILPNVEKFCQEILAADRSYRHNEPAEFVDKQGVRWTRATA